MKDPFTALFPPSALEGVLPADTPKKEHERKRQVWSVEKLLSIIREQIEIKTGRIWLSGEVSSLSCPVSGHKYFSLKDKSCEIKAVLFKKRRYPGFKIENGQEVICFGRPDIYTARGALQFIVERIELKGTGDLNASFERLKKRLEKEGLFDSSLKRSLPVMPEKVYIITSPAGAAVQDFIKTTRKNHGSAEIIIVPSTVQGDDAPEQLCAALSTASALAGDNDVIVLARGGGSMEDLNAFNDEGLARMIRRAGVPVISAVGHETDFTIADFSADLRAPTPTAAASLIFQHQAGFRNKADELAVRLKKAAMTVVTLKHHKLETTLLKLRSPERQITYLRFKNDELSSRLVTGMKGLLERKKKKAKECRTSLELCHPSISLNRTMMEIKELKTRMNGAIKLLLEKNNHQFAMAAERLNASSPLTHLAQGYSLVTMESTGKIIRSASDVKKGDIITIRPQKGLITARITEHSQKDMEEIKICQG